MRALVERLERDLATACSTLLSKPSRADALDVQTQVNARARGRRAARRAGARAPTIPDELNAANGWLVEALEFRADAIEQIAAQLPAALGDERDSRAAIDSIAGQMQALLASDVIYLQRAIPELTAAYDKQGIDERFPTDRFLPDLGWLDPDTVETRLEPASAGGRAGRHARAARHRAPGRDRPARRHGADRAAA